MSGAEAVLSEFERAGYPRDEAIAAIYLESGWNPHALNTWAPKGGKPSYAAGLTQMMPATLKALGWTRGPHAYAELSAEEQAPWIGKLTRAWRPWMIPGDTYLALFMPAAIGASDTLVLGRKGGAIWKANPPLRSPGDGDITAGSVREVLMRKLEKLRGTSGVVATPRIRQRRAIARPSSGVAFVLLVLGGLYLSSRR